MIKKLIAAALILATLGTIIYWQHRQIKKLEKANIISSANVSALEDLRKNDQTRVNKLTAKVNQVQKERAELASQLQGINNAQITDFLSMPVPDSLRRAAEDYLAKRTKAPSNPH